MLNKLLSFSGYQICKKKTIGNLFENLKNIKFDYKEKSRILHQLEKLNSLNISSLDEYKFLFDLIIEGNSKSQDLQDIKLLLLLKLKMNGYFMEFGADDGILNSNSYLLEHKFGWKGALIEPNPLIFNKLKKNRLKSHVYFDLIYSTSGEKVNFIIAGQLSTISKYSALDNNFEYRKNTTIQTVELSTISFSEFLTKINSPKEIDFLSIDTEGSEFDILSSIDYNIYSIKVICVEHNNTDNKERIYNLMKLNHYEEIVFDINSIDSFYIKNS
jgi:FkbM family methyltransferase